MGEVVDWIGSSSLTAGNIVDETTVFPDVVLKFREESVLVDAVVDGCVGWCWWCAHIGTIIMYPCSVTKCKKLLHMMISRASSVALIGTVGNRLVLSLRYLAIFRSDLSVGMLV
jgi:hypothetical protein